VNSNIGAPASAASSRPPTRTDFRTPIGPRLLTLFGAVVCAGASVFLTGVALLVLFLKQWAFESALFTKLAADIAARAGVPLRELGMVEGGGALGVWGTRAADWTAPALSPARQYQMWRRVAMTGALPIPVIVIAFLVRMLIG
jgi:hypothetical protein